MCGARAEVVLRGAAEVTVGTIAALVERRPVVACDADHERSPGDIVGTAMDAVDAAVPRARARLLRDDACGSCRSVLTMPVRRSTRAVTVEPSSAPVFTIRLDLPLVRCTDCGLDQVPSRSQEDLTVVVPALFAAGHPV
ncbi:MAG: hypothetical protein JJT89_07565 [Nitriliruptoraceae bacterium]|nr:hypothetical protein [Nitriliruptoraceae bacterium]